MLKHKSAITFEGGGHYCLNFAFNNILLGLELHSSVETV